MVGRSVGGSFIFCGLIAWQRRPDNHIGPLMTLTGFVFLAEAVVAWTRRSPTRSARVGELVDGLVRRARPRVPERADLLAHRLARSSAAFIFGTVVLQVIWLLFLPFRRARRTSC